MDLDFTEDEISRYSRHILLAEVGGVGQAKLRAARVLVIGAGGLGSPLALYLAAAGVGTIGLVDDDAVDLSNLQRQIAHTTERLGQPKVQSAAAAARAINPAVVIDAHRVRLDARNALDLIGDYDLVCDGSDNFATRFLVSDACVLARRTLVSAAVLRFDGQLSTFQQPPASARAARRRSCRSRHRTGTPAGPLSPGLHRPPAPRMRRRSRTPRRRKRVSARCP
jgi:adenylyltransferase/sulfurtransferase